MKKGKKGIVFIGVICATLIGGIIGTSFDSGAGTGAEEVTEIHLLQKDSLIEEICIVEDGVNPYFASTKTVLLSNLKYSKLVELQKKGVKIKITGVESKSGLSVPVEVIKNEIVVSIHSSDEALIGAINNI